MSRLLFFFIFSIFAEAQECGGEVDLFAGYISSPGFDAGEEYANRLDCTWVMLIWGNYDFYPVSDISS